MEEPSSKKQLEQDLGSEDSEVDEPSEVQSSEENKNKEKPWIVLYWVLLHSSIPNKLNTETNFQKIQIFDQHSVISKSLNLIFTNV